MRRTMACMFLLGTAVMSTATAGDSGLYMGASLGRVEGPNNAVLGVGPRPLDGKLHDGDISWGVNLGYRFNPYLAIDFGYVDLGELDATVEDPANAARATMSFAAEGPSVAMIASLPLGRWQPYLKGGVLFTSTELEYRGSGSGTTFRGEIKNNVKDALYGVGVNYALTYEVHLSLDVTYVEVGAPARGTADLLNTSLGMTWKF